MPPPKTKLDSPFQATPAGGGGWQPTRKRPALKRERGPAPAGSKDAVKAEDEPATGIASQGSADSRKI